MTAFNFNKWQKWSQGDAVGANNNWNYTDTTSTLATILTANYFDDVNNLNPSGILQINDVIYVVGSDGAEYCIVTAITPHVTIAAFSITIPAGSIVNADVNAAAAIDFSKLAALPSADILVGSAGNVPTATAVTGDVTINNTGVTAIGAGKVLSAMLDPAITQIVTVPVTAAQLNAAYGAPFILIAAPGANKLIVVKSVAIEVNYGSAQFANGGVVALQYDNTVHGAGTLASATIAAATVTGWAADSTLVVAGAMASAAASTTSNKGIYLSNDTAAFITGTGTTLALHIQYAVITTTF